MSHNLWAINDNSLGQLALFIGITTTTQIKTTETTTAMTVTINTKKSSTKVTTKTTTTSITTTFKGKKVLQSGLLTVVLQEIRKHRRQINPHGFKIGKIAYSKI